LRRAIPTPGLIAGQRGRQPPCFASCPRNCSPWGFSLLEELTAVFGSITCFSCSRGDWIRTSDRPAPSRVRYQTAPLPVASDPSLARDDSKRATGIEPALEAWKASVQPQHFARKLPRMIPAGIVSSEPPTASAASRSTRRLAAARTPLPRRGALLQPRAPSTPQPPTAPQPIRPDAPLGFKACLNGPYGPWPSSACLP
jgi:hypothetical protein